MKLYKNLKQALKEREQVEALKITIKEKDFPQEILNFTNLKELYLESSCQDFPRAMPSWQSLRIVSFKLPDFTGDLSDLLSLPQLENLKIIETPLKSFLLPLGHAKAPLKSLTIKDCELERLPEELSMLNRLIEMNLSGNKLSALPVSMVDLKQLKRLNLDGNHFEQFPDIIKRMPHLAHLSIDHNKFDDEERARIQREYNISPN